MKPARRHGTATGALAVALAVTLAAAAGGCSGSPRQPTPPGGTTGGSGPSGTGTPPGSSSPPAVTGNGTASLGVKWNYFSLPAASDGYLHQISGGATWYELTWCKVEPDPGRFDWGSVDQVVADARQYGFTLLLKLRTGACWATQGGPQHARGSAGETESRVPNDYSAYAAFVRTAVARYYPRGVHEFAIENEINAPVWWAGTPADYAHLATVAAAAVHAAAPAAQVVDPGLASPVYGVAIANRLLAGGQPDQAVAAYRIYYTWRIQSGSQPDVADPAALRAELAGTGAVRDLAFMSVDQQLLAEHVFAVRQLHFYEPSSAVPDLIAYLKATTPAGVPVEGWEVGQFWPTGPDDQAARAADAARTLGQLFAGGVRMAIWLPLNGTAATHYGLEGNDGTPRLTGATYLDLVGAARGGRLAPIDRPGLHGVAFGHASTTALLVWSDRSGTLHLPAPPTTAPQSAAGGTVPVSSASLPLSTTPVLVTVAAPLDDVVSTLAIG